MSRIERGIAALLLAIAVAGGAFIPRLLSEPAGPLGVALAPAGPERIVVQAPAIPKPPRPAIHPTFVASPPAGVTPSRFAPAAASPPAANQRSASPPAPTKQSPTPPPATLPTTPTLATDLATSPNGTRPGNGFGDKNHVHTGPPGHASEPAQPEPAQSGSDLRGSGHGRPVQQATSHPVGTHGRGVGHLAKTPPAAAAAAHAARPQARPQARGSRSHGSPPQAVGHGNGHSNAAPPPAAQGHGQGHSH